MTKFFYKVVLVAPASVPAVVLSIGILAFWANPLVIACILFVCSVLLFWKVRYNSALQTKKIVLFFSILFFFFLGYFVAQKQLYDFAYNEQLFAKTDKVVYATITDIERTPDARFPYCITLQVFQIQQEEEIIPCRTKIKCNTFRFGRITVGDTVSFVMPRYVPVTNQFRFFLLKEGINAYLFMPKFEVTRISRPQISLARFLYRKRGALFSTLKKKCLEKTRYFFELLFLGRKEKESEIVSQIKDSFQYWGISHMTARSGMHMAICVMIFYLFLQCFPLSYTLKQYVLALIMMLYALFSYPSLSFVRAVFTTGLLLYCQVFFRRTNMLHVTFLVYMIQLIFNPIILFFLDFQLSFLLTIGICFFSKRIFLKY